MTDTPLHMDVRLKRGDFTLAATLNAGPGITALFGRSGAGKSTIVSLLSGLLNPDEGTISIGDKVLFDSSKNINTLPQDRHVGCVFQEARLFPHLTVVKNLEYGMHRLPANQHVKMFTRVIDVLGLADLLYRRPAHLSGGERQRVAIGRALLSNPRILLMDEPLANLDGARKEEILTYIEHVTETFGIPVVYVSHSIDEVVRLADTMILVDGGRIAAIGPVEDIMGRLDLSPLTGRYEAGAVLNLRVANHDISNGLTQLRIQGHTLFTPKTSSSLGKSVRLRLRARDVALALTPPKGTSILNQLPVTITDINLENGPHVEVALSIRSAPDFEREKTQIILARITKKSFKDLRLAIGNPAHALIKAVAIDRQSLGKINGNDKP